MATMTHRERALTALRRRVPDRVPRFADYGTFAPGIMARFHARVGDVTPEDWFDYDIRCVNDPAPALTAELAAYVTRPLRPGEYVDARTGNICRLGAHENISVATHYALAEAETEADFARYPLDDPSPRLGRMVEVIRALHHRGYAVIGPGCSVFERVWGVRGFEAYLMDLLTERPLAVLLAERQCEINCRVARLTALAGADILRTGDDFGTEKGMLLHPDLWREVFKPLQRRIIRAAKEVNPDILAFYHSDGDITPILGDLVEIGVDILNPVQPECMDPAALKRQYGDRLAFWGGIGTQTTMPFGTPEEVEAVVRLRMETVGKGGGYVLAPTHLLQDEVPLENVFALYAAADRWGVYGGAR